MSVESRLSAAQARARAFRSDTIEPAVEQTARHCVLDWFACAVAGAPSAEARSVEKLLPVVTEGGASLIGLRAPRSLMDAALFNGVASHALDFDDLNPAMSSHASVAIIPALLAVGQARGLTLTQILPSLVAGVEYGAEVGALVSPRHYAEGWHATGTVGAIAAAAAIAHLLGLDPERFRTAVTLASTLGGGLRGMFGTMAKPLHAGRAASAGVLAGLLAQDGFSAARDGLGGPLGFVTMFGAEEAEPSNQATAPAILGTVFKLVAACTGTHASVENARSVMRAADVRASNVERVEIWVSPENETVCGIDDPRSGMEVKFSIRTTTALAFLGWDLADEASYQAAVTAEEVSAFADRIEVVYDPPMLGNPFAARMRVTTFSGETHAAETDAGRPSVDFAERERRLREKFRVLVEPRTGPANAELLEDAVLSGTADAVVRVMALTREETSEKESTLSLANHP